MNKDIEVTLTWAELMIGANIGLMRCVQSLKEGRGLPGTRRETFGGTETTWASNIEGTAGEMAVAKYLDRYWSGNVGDIDADDVGPYQVKTNTSRKWDDLIIRPWNKPDRIYIGVLSFIAPKPGTAKFIITGWIWGEDAMTKDYWRENVPMPGYFFPRKLLHDMSELP